MADIALAFVGLGGTCVCLGLAYWVLRRGRSSAGELGEGGGGREQLAAAGRTQGDGTESMPGDEILAAAAKRADANPRTEYMTREQVLAAAGQGSAADEPATEQLGRTRVLGSAKKKKLGRTGEPATEHMTREQVLAAARRAPGPDEPATEHISREQVLAAADRRAAADEPATEHMTREQVLGIAAGDDEGAETPPTTLLSREQALALALANKPEPTPATEFLPREAVITTPPASQTAVPKFEPKHVPTLAPAPAPASASASGPDISTETLAQHLREGLQALEQVLEALDGDMPPMRELADGPERTWRGHLEVLSLTGLRVLDSLLWPQLDDGEASPRRRLALALTLLELRGVDASAVVLERAAALDLAGRDALRAAVSYWDNPKADKLAITALDGAAPEERSAWLEVCVTRGCELPGEQLGELLASQDRQQLAAGLRLLPFAAEPGKHTMIVDRQLMAGPAQIREPALLAGLVLGRPSAKVVIKQAARDPAMPRACEAMALTGTEADRKSLLAWAGKPGAPAHAGWVLGLLGGPAALTACVERCGHTDAVVAEPALAGFRLATGFTGPADQVQRWWAEHQPEFSPGVRHLGGEPASAAALRRCLETASRRACNSLALELLLRSDGRVRLATPRLPSGHLAGVGQLEEAELIVSSA